MNGGAIQNNQQAQQPLNVPQTISAWVKCPTCGGVLGVPMGQSQGPCVFCNNVIEVFAVVRPAQAPLHYAPAFPAPQRNQTPVTRLY